MTCDRGSGFTLIELSIVLVIIGLIVGGVLVGQELIRAAEVRATISQIEKFNTAVNTFYGKYQALPGDMNAGVAEQFGFTPRGQYPGQGDGNGVIEGNYCNGATCAGGTAESAGETQMFWVDLTTANGMNLNLIPGAFSAGSFTTPPPIVAQTSVNLLFPEAKLGQGNFVYVYSDAAVNYYGIVSLLGGPWGNIQANLGMTVQQAYRIDKKMDDGIATAGNVQATGVRLETDFGWGGDFPVQPAPSDSPDSASTCYNSISGVYSVGVNGGQGANCDLTFKFQ